MNPYIKITLTTFTIWILTSMVNGLLSGIYLLLVRDFFESLTADILLIFFISLIFSAPGFFIFWIILLTQFAASVSERALFRTAIGTGVFLAGATAAMGLTIAGFDSSNKLYGLAGCILLSATTAVMMHFSQFKKIKLNERN